MQPSENSEPETNKTEQCVPLSPSAALSQISLNSPKRTNKVRRRYTAFFSPTTASFITYG